MTARIRARSVVPEDDGAYWNDVFEARYPVAIDTDHPLSLGYRLRLVSTSPYAVKSIRLRAADKAVMFPQRRVPEGLHCSWNGKWRQDLILINLTETTPWAKKRVIELLVHEVSHLVDEIMTRTVMRPVPTELRAYYNDWIVGKLLCYFPAIGK